ncbi:MAG: lasso peptide biosynthesis B2 protein [Leptolyngbyaceae bacterium]|nr:lasso peptide biosynthesis B2 protein [Leptolyngbyaceae bacterium]
MKHLHRFLRLKRGDRHLLIRTLVLLSLIRLGLRLLPFRTLIQRLSAMHQPTSSFSPTHLRYVGRCVWAVNVSSRLMPGDIKCLARALTTHLLLNQYGVDTELKLGVAKSMGGALEAHAWVEYQGQVIMGNLCDLSRFIPLPSLEGVRQ